MTPASPPSLPLTLRMAAPDDAPQLRALLDAGVRSIRSLPPGPFEAETEDEEIIVAEASDGRLAGFAAIFRPHRFLHHLYVSEDVQGRGVGAWLLDAATALAGGEIELKCLVNNRRAMAFYQRHGLHPTGETGADAGGAWLRLRRLEGNRGRMSLVATQLCAPAVRLEPLQESHREALRDAAQDAALWRWWPRPMDDWDATFDWQLEEHGAGRWLLHAVIAEGRAVGQTCYLALAPEHARVEIGGTWYAAGAQGGPVNPTAKYLMFAHAFACGAQRVELKTDALNARSRAAILKLGAAFEGVHRRHMRRPDGTFRDTAWYSVLAEEWPRVRIGLESRLGWTSG